MLLKCQFVFRKAIYKFSHRIDVGKRTTSFAILLSRTIFLQTIKSLFEAYILFLGDSVLIPIIGDKLINALQLTLDQEMTVNVILGGLGVAGVILGLYCSNITSIYSAKYANAPTNLASIFQRDIVTNKCVQQIVGDIILCIILLGECIVHVGISYMSLAVLLILTIRIVVVFSIVGSRTNMLSNTYQISESIYPEIVAAMNHVSSKHFYAHDKNFQNHFQKSCTNKLKDLKDISFFNKDNPSNQNAATLLFMSYNITLLEYYWKVKSAIRYDSLWYRDKIQYEPWHFSSDSSIELALRTGTSPQPRNARDHWWIECDIAGINEICFEKLCKDNDFETILKYINLLASLSVHAIDSGDILSWIHIITKTQTCFTSCYFNATLTEENSQTIATICVAFVATFISMIGGINAYLRKLDLKTVLNDIASISYAKDADITSNRLFNNKDTDDILYRISAEIKLEGKRITPDWYVKQIASKHIISFFNELLESIVIICDNVIEFGNKFLQKKQYFQSAAIFSYFLQFISKSGLTISAIDQNFNILHEQYIEPTIVWEESKLDFAKQKIEDVKKQLPQVLIKCSGAFALSYWSKREDYPDLLGFCYNHICEALISCIEKNDFEAFRGTYSGFISMMLLYQEFVRTDVIKIKEPHRQNAVFHVVTAPMVEYALISSLAILWGEFNNSSQWRILVDTELEKFIAEEENHILVLKRMTELAMSRKHHLLGIGNRDTLQFGWKQRIESAISKSDLCEYEYDCFGQRSLKTDSQLLKAFCGLTFFDGRFTFTHAVEDVYFVCCVNQYLPPESKYTGAFDWEENLNEN